MQASIADFQKIDIRVGKIIEVKDYPPARKPSYSLKIDFGPKIGIKQSIGQFTHYSKGELKGKLVAAVVNLPPLKIGPQFSEVLTLGFPDEKGRAILVVPEKEVPLGGRIY